MAAKWIEQKRQYRAYQARVAQLPADHRDAIKALERYLQRFGPTTGDGVLAVLEQLAARFEQGAATGTPAAAIVGANPVAFAEGLLGDQPKPAWIGREQARLTNAIA